MAASKCLLEEKVLKQTTDHSTNDIFIDNEKKNLFENFIEDKLEHFSPSINEVKYENQESYPFTPINDTDNKQSAASNTFALNFSNQQIEYAENIFKDLNIVWLQKQSDRNIFHQTIQDYQNVHNDEYDNYQCVFFIGCQQVPIYITEFHTFDECLHYIETLENKKIFLILPNALIEERLLDVVKYPQICLIYQLDSQKFWITKKSINDSIFYKLLLEQLKQLSDWTINHENMFHLLSNEAIKSPLKDIDNDSQTFIIYQLIIEIILRSERTENSEIDFIKYIDDIFLKRGRFIKDIEEFKLSFNPEKSIYWYTRPSFVYRLLTYTCSSNNIQKIFKTRYFICNLYDQLKKLHPESLSKFGKKFCVYRGKSMSNDEFIKLKNNIGNLVITKTFLSTTTDINVARQYAGEDLPQGFIGVIFCMIIDTITNRTKPFAYIASHSCISDENEVLISIGTIFKSLSINKISEDIWKIILERTHQEEILEQIILDQNLNINTNNQTNNINLMFEFLQNHCDEESSLNFTKLIHDQLSSFVSTNRNEQTMASRSGLVEWHTIECGNSQYTLPKRYQDLIPIGQGHFGVVARAMDTVTGKYVAIKKLLRPFQTETHAKRTYRELKLLIYLNRPDADVIQLYNVFTPEENINDFQTLYFVFNYVDYDLNKVIKRGIPFTEEHIRLIIYSLLRSLKFIHSAGIVHRDIKPTNIGISQNSDITILDFGLARVTNNDLQTGYVVTRWWRAPEIFINWEHYSEKVDIWSVGCIMAELILLKPLFPGTDHIDQLTKIFDIVGTPDLRTLDEICERNAREYIQKLPVKPKQDYNKLFGYKYARESNKIVSGVSSEGIALLDSLLSFDYRTRPSAEQALSHPYFKSHHDPTDEPSIASLNDEHQDATYPIAKWKSIIWQMIEQFVPPSWASEDPDDDED